MKDEEQSPDCLQYEYAAPNAAVIHPSRFRTVAGRKSFQFPDFGPAGRLTTGFVPKYKFLVKDFF